MYELYQFEESDIKLSQISWAICEDIGASHAGVLLTLTLSYRLIHPSNLCRLNASLGSQCSAHCWQTRHIHLNDVIFNLKGIPLCLWLFHLETG